MIGTSSIIRRFAQVLDQIWLQHIGTVEIGGQDREETPSEDCTIPKKVVHAALDVLKSKEWKHLRLGALVIGGLLDHLTVYFVSDLGMVMTSHQKFVDTIDYG